MKQEPKSIHSFKKGDVITRIKPSKPIMKLGEEDVVNRDYIGTPFVYVGIANGCIYLKRYIKKEEGQIENSPSLSFFKLLGINENSMINLELEIFEEGWSEYVDPDKLMNGSVDKNDSFSIKELELKKQEALEEENFEEAKKIQETINRKKREN